MIFAGPLFDRLFGLNCISSEAASNQAELTSFFSILFIFFLSFHGSLTFSNNVNLHEHFTYSFPFGQNLFVGSRFLPMLYRENIIAELQWLTQSAIPGAQASKSESFATQMKGPVDAQLL